MDLAWSSQQLARDQSACVAQQEKLLQLRLTYFKYACDLEKSKSDLQEYQELRKHVGLKVRTFWLMDFCLKYQASAFEDFVNQNLGLKELQEAVIKSGQDRSVVVENKHTDLYEKYQFVQARIHELEFERARAYDLIEILQKQIRGLKCLDRCPFQGYGEQMQRLCGLIKITEFSKMPEGPLGNCFTVLLPNWTALVEHIMSPFLNVFLADNQADGHKLNELIDKVYGTHALVTPDPATSLRPAVWVMKFTSQALDITRSKVLSTDLTGNGHTLLDLLRFEEEVTGMHTVRNFLVTNARVHKTILFNTQHEAFPVLAEKDALPKNCMHAYTLDGFSITPAPAFQTKALGMNGRRAKILKPLTPELSSVLKKLSAVEADVKAGVDARFRARQKERLNLAAEIGAVQKELKNLRVSLSPATFENLSFLWDEILSVWNYAYAEIELRESSFQFQSLFNTERDKLKKVKDQIRILENKIAVNGPTLNKLFLKLSQNYRVHSQTRSRNRFYSV